MVHDVLHRHLLRPAVCERVGELLKQSGVGRRLTLTHIVLRYTVGIALHSITCTKWVMERAQLTRPRPIVAYSRCLDACTVCFNPDFMGTATGSCTLIHVRCHRRCEVPRTRAVFSPLQEPTDSTQSMILYHCTVRVQRFAEVSSLFIVGVLKSATREKIIVGKPPLCCSGCAPARLSLLTLPMEGGRAFR